MRFTVVMADPAGNRTAIVRSGVPKADRRKVAAAVMADPALKAEQVGFETRPLYGGSLGRLEMAGGEFCGNAARSYGYLLCKEKGIDHCKIEMSGTREKLEVICDLDRETAAAQMPMEEFARRMIDRFGKAYSAFGVMFVNGDDLTPVVYVAELDSVCPESSCGSGSLAAAWFMTRNKEDGFHGYSFNEPGGTITVNIAKRQGKFAGTIGGKLALEAPVEMEI